MIGLFDRDVFLKLCCCNLWVEAIETLGVTQPYRLGATSDPRSNRKKITQLLLDRDPEEVIQRTHNIVSSVSVVPDYLVEKIYQSASFLELSNIEGIDGGEQILAAILIDEPDRRILLSGDKRFIKAFRENLPHRWEAVAASIISFESCMLAIEKRYGFDYLIQRVLPARQCDGSLSIAIGNEPNADSFRDAMRSFNPCNAATLHLNKADVAENDNPK